MDMSVSIALDLSALVAAQETKLPDDVKNLFRPQHSVF
jgi:hypothetical protein